ncbi:MAG: ABC transporter ATP-binding protein [archaeon]
MSYISCTNITKSFGKNKVLDGISLSIEKGEIFGLIGPSGCGKSTLMKIILGILQADSGTISIEGENLSKNTSKIKKLVGYTTQENSFYEKLTIAENMKYYSNLYGLYPKEDYIDNILKDVELLKHKKSLAGNISGGMKRRLDFAISLIHDPKILILDEPTTGLDPLLVEQFWAVVQKTAAKGKTVIVTSHIFSEIDANVNKVGIMNKGKFAKIIDLDKLKKSKENHDLLAIFKQAVQK